MAELGRASAPACLALGNFVLMHLLAAMVQLRQENRVMNFSLAGLLHAHQGEARRFATRIELEFALLPHPVFRASISQPDHERLDAMDDGSSTRQQEACPFRRTGHQWLFLFVENEDHDCVPFSFRNPVRGCLPRLSRLAQASLLANGEEACCVQSTAQTPAGLLTLNDSARN